MFFVIIPNLYVEVRVFQIRSQNRASVPVLRLKNWVFGASVPDVRLKIVCCVRFEKNKVFEKLHNEVV